MRIRSLRICIRKSLQKLRGAIPRWLRWMTRVRLNGGTEAKWNYLPSTQRVQDTALIFNTAAPTLYFCRCRGAWSCMSKRLADCTDQDKPKQYGATS